MITRDGYVKLCDFGIAKAVFETRESYTSPQEVLGTKDYIAPEYIIQGRITPAADVYAMGLSLLQLLIRKYRNTTAKPKSTRRNESTTFSADYLRIFNRYPTFAQMLAWDPQQRPTAHECAKGLYSIAQVHNELSFQQWSQKWITEIMAQLPPQKTTCNCWDHCSNTRSA